MLERAIAVDFEFLGLSITDPPTRRDQDQHAEDILCQRLLLVVGQPCEGFLPLGAVEPLGAEEPAIPAIRAGDQPCPSTMERTWVSVGFPDGKPKAGVWVL